MGVKILRFYGASDDLFECEGAINDEIDCFRRTARFFVTARDGADGLIVHGTYTNNGVWMVGVSQRDEGLPIPDWPMRFEMQKSVGSGPDYSVALVIEAPDDVSVASGVVDDEED